MYIRCVCVCLFYKLMRNGCVIKNNCNYAEVCDKGMKQF